MKAAVWYGRQDLRVVDWPEPRVREKAVKVRVKWCGICGSDVNEYASGPFTIPVGRVHPLTGRQAPLVLGHEFSGDVVEVGPGVEKIRPGDRIAVLAYLYCGKCYWCLRGQFSYCLILGSTGLCEDGGFAEYVVLPEYACFQMPESVSYEAGTLVEPLTVAVHACRRGDIKLGTSTVIIGLGPVGLLVLQAAKAAGANPIWGVEKAKSRLDLGLKLGATEVFDPDKIDVGKSVQERTNGMRADVAFDCAGGKGTLRLANSVTRRGGKIVNVALPREEAFPFDRFFVHEKELLASYAYTDEAPTALSLLAKGKVDASSMITGKILLEEILEKGIRPLLDGPGERVKVLVSPGK